MNRPLLQVALDHTDLPSAISAASILAAHVDVMEVGTILCYAEGVRAVGAIKALCPDHILVADLKAADAGKVVAGQVFSQGATWMTCICSAPIATMEAAKQVADTHRGDIQVELYGDWTFDHARQWKGIGLTQAIYHRGRDAAAAGQSWGEEDLRKIRTLAEMGFDVSVTGGLSPEDLHLFKGIPVKCFIAGRSLYGADDPAWAAQAFQKAIDDFSGTTRPTERAGR